MAPRCAGRTFPSSATAEPSCLGSVAQRRQEKGRHQRVSAGRQLRSEAESSTSHLILLGLGGKLSCASVSPSWFHSGCEGSTRSWKALKGSCEHTLSPGCARRGGGTCCATAGGAAKVTAPHRDEELSDINCQTRRCVCCWI